MGVYARMDARMDACGGSAFVGGYSSRAWWHASVCAHVSAPVRMCHTVRVCVCTRVSVCTPASVDIHACVGARGCVCVCVSVSVSVSVSVCVCVCVCGMRVVAVGAAVHSASQVRELRAGRAVRWCVVYAYACLASQVSRMCAYDLPARDAAALCASVRVYSRDDPHTCMLARVRLFFGVAQLYRWSRGG